MPRSISCMYGIGWNKHTCRFVKYGIRRIEDSWKFSKLTERSEVLSGNFQLPEGPPIPNSLNLQVCSVFISCPRCIVQFPMNKLANLCTRFMHTITYVQYVRDWCTFEKFCFSICLQMFFYTHHLFVVWWTLLILHAPNFWKWFIGPAIIYVVERIASLSIVNKARYGKTFIKEGIIFPSNVSKMRFFTR